VPADGAVNNPKLNIQRVILNVQHGQTARLHLGSRGGCYHSGLLVILHW
ncbi:hypothetical protein THOM_2416, partial [Trachipleistophora hominis]